MTYKRVCNCGLFNGSECACHDAPKIEFLGPAKMIGDVTYWAPPRWKFWQRKLRHSIIDSATKQANGEYDDLRERDI